MKKIILFLFIFLMSPSSYSTETIICAYSDVNLDYYLDAELVQEDDWNNGIVIIPQHTHIRVYSLGRDGNTKRILKTVYMSDDWAKKIPTSEEIEKNKKDIMNMYRGANTNPDVEIEVPGLFLVQQGTAKIVNNQYIDRQEVGYIRTLAVMVDKRDHRKLTDYCPGKRTKKGVRPPWY